MKFGSLSVLAGAFVVVHVGAAVGGTNTWTDTGPKGANVRVEFSSSPDIAYARGGDKLWKSVDGGQNWTALFSKNAAVFLFTVDSTDPNAAISGTNPDPIATNNASSAQLSITAPTPAGNGSSNGGGGGGGALDLISVIALLGMLVSLERRRRRGAFAR